MSSSLDFCQMANYTTLGMSNSRHSDLGQVIKQQRLMMPLTLQQLASRSSVSASHLGRIERGERFPSGSILRKIARPLGYDADELFTLAGYLSPQTPGTADADSGYSSGQLVPYVARALASEPVEVQHAVTGILSILKSVARSMVKQS